MPGPPWSQAEERALTAAFLANPGSWPWPAIAGALSSQGFPRRSNVAYYRRYNMLKAHDPTLSSMGGSAAVTGPADTAATFAPTGTASDAVLAPVLVGSGLTSGPAPPSTFFPAPPSTSFPLPPLTSFPAPIPASAPVSAAPASSLALPPVSVLGLFPTPALALTSPLAPPLPVSTSATVPAAGPAFGLFSPLVVDPAQPFVPDPAPALGMAPVIATAPSLAPAPTASLAPPPFGPATPTVAGVNDARPYLRAPYSISELDALVQAYQTTPENWNAIAAALSAAGHQRSPVSVCRRYRVLVLERQMQQQQLQQLQQQHNHHQSQTMMPHTATLPAPLTSVPSGIVLSDEQHVSILRLRTTYNGHVPVPWEDIERVHFPGIGVQQLRAVHLRWVESNRELAIRSLDDMDGGDEREDEGEGE